MRKKKKGKRKRTNERKENEVFYHHNIGSIEKAHGDYEFCKYIILRPKRWKPKDGELYEFIKSTGHVGPDRWEDHNIDKHRYELGNCFKVGEAKNYEMIIRQKGE